MKNCYNTRNNNGASFPTKQAPPASYANSNGDSRDQDQGKDSDGDMDFLRSPFVPNPASSLQAPPPRRISTVAGERLTAIFEDRPSTPLSATSRSARPNRWSDSTALSRGLRPGSRDSQPSPHVLHSFRQDEKPSADKRGGWKRFALLGLVVVVVIAIALGVGLGVGLSRRKWHTKVAGVAAGENKASKTSFPLGDYSLVTALRTVQTTCTSNPATWRCFPYTTYASSPAGSVATFDWTLTNTSSFYHTNVSSLSTNPQGVPANLSISSYNPFAISFKSAPLTYVNVSSPHYTFSINMSQKIIPSSPITSENRATACYFNNTQLVGTLYLSDAINQDYPININDTSSTPWPYAVHVELQSNGGSDTPACYYTNNGVIGDRIIQGLSPVSADNQCICDYSNYS